MTDEAMAHAEHCAVLITACLHPTEKGSMVAAINVGIDEDLSPLALIGVAHGIAQLAERLIAQGEAQQARSN